MHRNRASESVPVICVCKIEGTHAGLNNIMKLKNVATANALQLEAARRRAVPLRFNFVTRAKFEVAQPIRCRLKAFYSLYVTLRCDLEI